MVLNDCGHVCGSPTGEVVQSWDRMRAPISPPSCKKGNAAKDSKISEWSCLAVMNVDFAELADQQIFQKQRLGKLR
jgi:hypothetical protein